MVFLGAFLVVLSVLLQVFSLKAKTDDRIAAAWYLGRHATEAPAFTLANVSWSKYNTLIYSFALTTPSVNDLSFNGSNLSLLPQFVQESHAHGVAAHISIGSWSGSQWFSSDVATPENRTAFVKTLVDFTEKYDLDGINFAWEYPNTQGIGCNTINANDTQNFLSFLQELRQDPVGANLTLSAVAPLTPFRDASGNPSTNVTAFTEVFDYITIMNSDVWAPWTPTVGPNSPLNDTCALPVDQRGSAVSAVKAWTAAGMPVNKIVLGLPSYGHSFSVSPTDAFVDGSKTELAAYAKFNVSNQPVGDEWGGTAGYVNVCGVYTVGPGGTFNFWGLVDGGFLTEEGLPAPGIHYLYDDCSQTPYVYNETSQVMVPFDNAQSWAVKGNYIKETGLRGFSMWEAGGDYRDILLDSIRRTAGFD